MARQTGDEEGWLAALRLAKDIHDVSTTAAQTGDWRLVEAMFVRLDALRCAFKGDCEVAENDALASCGAISCAAQTAVNTGDWRRVDALFERFDSLRRSFPETPYIAQMYAQSAVYVI